MDCIDIELLDSATNAFTIFQQTPGMTPAAANLHLNGSPASASAYGANGSNMHVQPVASSSYYPAFNNMHLANNNRSSNNNKITNTVSGCPSYPVQEEFQEIKAITLEWRLSNLKSIFETSRGEAKSRCIKSSVFGDGKWEIYFYANSVCMNQMKCFGSL